MGKYIYKNMECEQKMHDFYNRTLSSLNVKYEELTVNTLYGKTHLLIIGDKTKGPYLHYMVETA